LVITLVLLALLVLAVFALSALTKVGSEMSSASVYQTQARQNAALALSVALGELQRHAGDDDRVTGMAGITGVAGNPNATTRYWCGVWRADGSFVTWLTSGAINATSAGPDTVELIAQGSVGAASSTSPNVEKEHVIAGKIPVTVRIRPAHPACRSGRQLRVSGHRRGHQARSLRAAGRAGAARGGSGDRFVHAHQPAAAQDGAGDQRSSCCLHCSPTSRWGCCRP
jgi:hypothetical protein